MRGRLVSLSGRAALRRGGVALWLATVWATSSGAQQAVTAPVRILGPAAAAAASAATGQEPAGGEPGAAAGEEAAAPAAAGTAASVPPRVQKLTAQGFERRPSAILEARAAGPPAEAAEGDLDAECAAFGRLVTLGRWDEVGRALAGWGPEEGQAVFRLMVLTFLSPPKAQGVRAGQPARPVQPQFLETHLLAPQDVLELGAAAPVPLEDGDVAQLGSLLAAGLKRGDDPRGLMARLETGVGPLGGSSAEGRRLAARLLDAAGLAAENGRFLPGLEDAAAAGDWQGCNLLARQAVARHEAEGQPEDLERAWTATQAVLGGEGSGKAEQDEALQRALQLAPAVRDALGETWLEASFTDHPERGMRILAAIGGLASAGRGEIGAAGRLEKLRLQHRAVQALLDSAPGRAGEWKDVLELLALNWLREAEYSQERDQSSDWEPQQRWDRYGNIYYVEDAAEAQQQNGQQPQAIVTGELLDLRPDDRWLAAVGEGIRPRFSMVTARLLLKVQEEERAFPHIEALARDHPGEAAELVDAFLDVWTANHDPNRKNERRSRYMYVFGYNQRADAIPLTRSKQVRNLEELAGWVRRLRSLPVGELDEERLAKAFMTCHGTAEVYRMEDLQRVFGPPEEMAPETVATIARSMGALLAGVWSKPETQEKQQTRRSDAEIEAEVLRGYAEGRALVSGALLRRAESWQLQLAAAVLAFDEEAYRSERSRDAGHTERRRQTFEAFHRAAELYAAALPGLAEDEESAEVYEIWFYAGLGATDLGGLRSWQQPARGEPAGIRAAIEALPGAASERHRARFANSLTVRISAVNAELKQRYLEAGLEIAGDHPKAREAARLLDYYRDLVTEIELRVAVDGPPRVGHTEPFGAFVHLRHTAAIERESGGFQRYLQNQQSSAAYFNYGRPQKDYRDAFEESAREALAEHFEVLSVTFHSEKVESRGDPEDGWRVTPYAYLLLRARGAEVDRLPPLRLDLDFVDTSGFVVLPVASAPLAIDASAADPERRPLRGVRLTQTLDERAAAEGKLQVEIRARGTGLIPALEELAEVRTPGFAVTRVDDQGVGVAELDASGEEVGAVTERSWVVDLAAEQGPAAPSAFRFFRPRRDAMELVFQRYDDADLVEVAPEVALGTAPSASGGRWLWLIGVGMVLLAGGLVAAWRLRARLRSRGGNEAGSGWVVPAVISPLTVLHLLQRMLREAPLPGTAQQDLQETIDRLERGYFARGQVAAPDLKGLAEEWVRRAMAGEARP